MGCLLTNKDSWLIGKMENALSVRECVRRLSEGIRVPRNLNIAWSQNSMLQCRFFCSRNMFRVLVVYMLSMESVIYFSKKIHMYSRQNFPAYYLTVTLLFCQCLCGNDLAMPMDR